MLTARSSSKTCSAPMIVSKCEILNSLNNGDLTRDSMQNLKIIVYSSRHEVFYQSIVWTTSSPGIPLSKLFSKQIERGR